LENWADLLAFVPRRQLVAIVRQIGDRQFARALQFRIHEFGNISLREMSTHPVRRYMGSNNCMKDVLFFRGPPNRMKDVLLYRGRPLKPTLHGPIPKNVKNFNVIHLWFAFSIQNTYI
jgi:hypothetical protein